MKQSIHPGGIKQLSASKLRALNGDLKCTTAGDTFIAYNYSLVYTTQSGSGIVTFTLPGTPPFDPPNGKPHAKWVLKITTNITTAMPTVDRNGQPLNANLKFSLRENALVSEGFGGNPGIVPAIDDDQWSAVKLIGQSGTAVIWEHWTLAQGPDLKNMGTANLSAVSSNVFLTILPAQQEFCSIQFFPYMFVNESTAPQWRSFGDSVHIGQLTNPTLQLSWAPNLFPNGTVIGTVKYELWRIDTRALFVWTTTPPRTINFQNKTFFNPALAPVWDWDFGDGTAHSALQNPSHTYAHAGTYNAKLTATDLTGAVSTFDQFVLIPLKASFTYSGRNTTVGGQPVNQVTFTDTSLGAEAWDWDFGDGSSHGTTQNPVHNYPRGQTFTVILTITSGANSDQYTLVITT